MSAPRLAPWERHTPTTYVVDRDLLELFRGGELAARHASELRQWRRRDQKKHLRRHWLSAVQMAIVAVHGLFRGLRPGIGLSGELGCGVQCSAASWAAVLGCEERAVTKAFARLRELGLLKRWRVLRPHKWDSGARVHSHADVHGASYLTVDGAAWLAERAGKTRQLVVQHAWGKAPGERVAVQRRVLTAAGVVGNLLRTAAEKLRRLANRLSPLSKQDRPEAEDSRRESKTSGRVGGRAGFPRPPAGSAHVARKGDPASDDAERQRLRELFDQRRLTPWDAWPEAWGRPLKTFEKRSARHGYLETECERWIRRFEDEANATGPTQPEFRHRPDDPRPRKGAAAARQHDWSAYEC